MNYIALAAGQLEDNATDVREKVKTLFNGVPESESVRTIRAGFDGAFEKQSELLRSLENGVHSSAEVIRYMRGLARIDGDAWEKLTMEALIGQAHKRLVAALGQGALASARFTWEFGESGKTHVVGNPYVMVHGLCLVLKEAIRSNEHGDQSVELNLHSISDNRVRCRVTYGADDQSQKELKSLVSVAGEHTTNMRTARAVLSDQGVDLIVVEQPDSTRHILELHFPGDVEEAAFVPALR